ncbi:MAG: hypothetical protein IPJ41_06210 [Phycisphaerales bacterium]|nr:hypothetical protein [Phycisphaerales bacterium]
MTHRVFVVALATSAGLCLAQQADEKALDHMIEYYAHLQGCSLSVGLEVHGGGSMMQAMLGSMSQSSPGYGLKPNRFAFWNAEGVDGADEDSPPLVYSDGKQVISVIQSLSVYTVEAAPANFGSMLAGADPETVTGWQMIPGSQFLFALLSDDPRKSLEGQLTNFVYKGLEGEGESACHVYTTTEALPEGEGEGGTIEMRIAATGEPWLVSLKPDLTGSGAPEGLELLLAFKDWKALTEAPAEGVITPKDEWKKVEDLGAAIYESMGAGPENAEPADVDPGDGG